MLGNVAVAMLLHQLQPLLMHDAISNDQHTSSQQIIDHS